MNKYQMQVVETVFGLEGVLVTPSGQVHTKGLPRQVHRLNKRLENSIQYTPDDVFESVEQFKGARESQLEELSSQEEDERRTIEREVDGKVYRGRIEMIETPFGLEGVLRPEGSEAVITRKNQIFKNKDLFLTKRLAQAKKSKGQIKKNLVEYASPEDIRRHNEREQSHSAADSWAEKLLQACS